jgi:hypothetical protein
MEWVVQFRWLVLVAITAITVGFGYQIRNLAVDMDPDLWAPQNHPLVKVTKELEATFGGRNFTVIAVVPKQGDIYQPAILNKVKRIQKGLESIPTAIKRDVLSVGASRIKSIRGDVNGMNVHEMLGKIPETPSEMKRFREDVATNPMYIDALVSADGKAAAVVADFRINKDNPSYAALYNEIQKVIGPERDASVDIYAAGLPIDLAWFEFHMQKMPMYFGIALLLNLVIQFLSFRSIQGMIVPTVTALLSVIIGLGAMGLMDVHLDGMNTTTPILIMAVAAGHSIQMLKRFYEEYHRLSSGDFRGSTAEANKQAVIDSMTRVGPVMLLAGVISAIAFFSLTSANISVVRHFGFFAGSGILAALILEMTLVPALRASLRAPRNVPHVLTRKAETTSDRLFGAIGRAIAGGRAGVIVLAGVLLALAALAGIAKIKVDNSLKTYNKPNSEVIVHDEEINRRFAGTNSVLFLVDGGSADALKNPALLKAMAGLQGLLDGQPHVGKTQSIADLIKKMNQAMHEDRPEYFTIPDDVNLISQYLFLYSISGDPQDFDNLVDNDYRKAVIRVYLKSDSTVQAQALYDKAQNLIAQSFPAGVTVNIGGSLPQTIAINEVFMKEKLENIVQMAVVVLLLASLALRSLKGGALVTLPLVVIVLANFGLLGWVGIPLDMGTASIASMAIGIGVDFEIYMLFRFMEELRRGHSTLDATVVTLKTSGKAVVFVTAAIAFGYAPLLTADFSFYRNLAIMVLMTVSAGAFSSVVFLRAVVVLTRPGFIFQSRPAEAKTALAATLG